MKKFTTERTAETRDEIWLVQHPPTYTQGLAGKPEHLLHATNIPVIKIDRGGQITYHGPGQIIAYLLLDLRRWKINVRELVRLMEQAVIDLLGEFGVAAQGREDAPGVYVGDAKIASLGLKIKHGCCYHGLALNVDMDLTPFANINPCGHAGLRVTQCCELGITAGIEELQALLAQNLIHGLQQHFFHKTYPGPPPVGAPLAGALPLDSATARVAPTGNGATAPEKHQRRSIRLKSYDYASAGCYAITICTQNHAHRFGEIRGEEMQPNPMAIIATDQWLALPQRFPQLTIDAFVVMPNHIHGLLALDIENRATATIGQIVGAYKSLVFNACLDWCKTQDLILGQLWQRNYHEHIVRNEIELNAWRQYIHDNPQRWHEDHENITP